jgi:hypothetical protein
MISLPLAEVAAAIEADQRRRVVDIQVVDAQTRSYSNIWGIAVRFNGDVLHYVVKEAGEGAYRQAELSRRADLLFAGDPSVAPIGLLYVEKLELTIGRAFSGSSLAASMTWHLLASPLRRYRKLRRGLRRAGRWLARYHAAASVPPSGVPLLDYIDNRRAALAELPAAMRKRILEIAREPFESTFTIVHGDFTAGNILVDDERLCVIDFGVGEWTAMSAWWDVATLLMSLRRSLLFSAHGPMGWLPALLRPLERAFLVGYGRAPLEDRDFLRCLAVRHFTYWAQDPSGSLDVRTRWHFDHLATILNALSRDRVGAAASER